MFLISKSSPMTISGATSSPDLSLHISPPAAQDHEHIMAGCITKTPRSSSSSGSDLTQENTFDHHQYQQSVTADMGGFVTHAHQFDQPRLRLGFEMGELNHQHPITVPLQPHHHQNHHYHLPRIYNHDFERRLRMVDSVRRSARAPRMRWTSTLHAHFIHAVQLLGGHERATPKSVQELMNVKDLTLAHVKSHLQMYRTVKSTDKGAAGLADMQVINPRAPMSLFEARGGISPPVAVQPPQRRSWTSSLETNDISHYTIIDTPSAMNDTKADEVDVEVTLRTSKKMKLETSGTNSSSLASERLLNLEFTLGRPSRQVDQII